MNKEQKKQSVHKLTGKEVGSLWEAEVKRAFKALRKQYAFSWHRFTDSHAAGNIVQAQPSDYLVVLPGQMGYLEAKASVTNKHPIPSMLRPEQRQTILHEGRLLDIPYFVLFGDLSEGTFTLVDGKVLVSDDWKGKFLLKGAVSQMVEQLAAYWELPTLVEVVRSLDPHN